jgi:hypothetical protein
MSPRNLTAKERDRMRTFSAWTPLIAGTLAVAGLLGGCGNAAAPPPPVAPKAPAASKADPPLDIELVFVADPDAAKPGRLTIAVTSSLDLPDVEVTVRLPDGAVATEGAPAWRGRIDRGRRQMQDLAVRVPAGRCELLATARADLGGGTVVARSASLVIHEGSAKPELPTGTVRTDSRGEKIYDARVEPRR